MPPAMLRVDERRVKGDKMRRRTGACVCPGLRRVTELSPESRASCSSASPASW